LREAPLIRTAGVAGRGAQRHVEVYAARDDEVIHIEQ